MEIKKQAKEDYNIILDAKADWSFYIFKGKFKLYKKCETCEFSSKGKEWCGQSYKCVNMFCKKYKKKSNS